MLVFCGPSISPAGGRKRPVPYFPPVASVCGGDERKQPWSPMLSLGFVVLWSGGPRIFHSYFAGCSGVCLFSFPGLPNGISQNEHPLFCFFLVVSLPLGLTLFRAFSWDSQETILEVRKNEHGFFLLLSGFNPNSAQDNMGNCIWLGKKEVWKTNKKNKNSLFFFFFK